MAIWKIPPPFVIPTMLINGGADFITDEFAPAKKEGVKLALRVGYETLMRTGNAVDAVQAAIMFMESDLRFNAGNGSVLTWEGNIEMDAGIMNGANLMSGSVSLVRDILHPIALARSVMDNSRHSYLAAHGARNYAVAAGFEILPPGSLVTEQAKNELVEYRKSYNCSFLGCEPIASVEIRNNIAFSPGTVGAVAIDAYGNLAAGTSTGGMTGKMGGRIGDGPILGGGTYADNKAGGISSTGHGESVMRFNSASRILHLIKYFGLSAQEATTQVLDELTTHYNKTAGIVCLDHKGNVGIHFTTRRLLWAYRRQGGDINYGFYKGEHIVEEPKDYD